MGVTHQISGCDWAKGQSMAPSRPQTINDGKDSYDLCCAFPDNLELLNSQLPNQLCMLLCCSVL